GQSLTLSAGQDADGGMPAVSGDIRLNGVASTAGTAVLHARGGGVIEDAGIGNHLVADQVELIAGRVGTQANALSMHANTLAARVDAGLHIEAADNLQLRAVTASQASIAAAG